MNSSVSQKVIKIFDYEHQKRTHIHNEQVKYLISSSLLQEHLEFTPSIILITLFWSKNTIFALVEFQQKIISYLIIEWKYAK